MNGNGPDTARCPGRHHHAAVLVIVIFLMTLWERDLSTLIGGVFTLSMTSMILSLIYFMRDVNLSLAALRKKLKE